MKREIEHRWRELGEFVREQRRLGQLSLRRLSEKSGISNPYLSQIERGQRRPSAEILQQLARALEISAETLYVRAGILEERASGSPASDNVVAAIRGARDLTEEQKRTLIHIYQSFRAEPSARLDAAVGAKAPVPAEPGGAAERDQPPEPGDAPAGPAAPGGEGAAADDAAAGLPAPTGRDAAAQGPPRESPPEPEG